MPKCPWCGRRVWLWRSNLYGGPCAQCWRTEARSREMVDRAADGSLTDARLEGTWRSNAVRTVAEWREHRPLTDEQASKLGTLFGHLRVTFAGQRVTYDYSRMPRTGEDQLSTSGRYAVVARDATSVVILTPEPNSDVPVLAHLHFIEPNVYRVQTDLSPRREYFSRE
jgi:hypothetical protein